MSSSLIQRSFSAGEIAVDLYARADQTKYQTGLKKCSNFVVKRHGGVENRAGSKMIQEVKDSAARTYFLKFVFNADQTYVIEVGNQYMRFYRNGARIVVSGVAGWSAITTYAAGNLVSSGGVYYYCILAHINQLPPNATYWYPLTGSIFEVPTPYLTADLALLKYDQSGDVITITHPSYQPRELRRTGHTAWTLPLVSTAPAIDAPINLVAAAGAAGALYYAYKVTAVKADTYEESTVAVVSVVFSLAPTQALPNTMTWDAVAGAVEYNVYLDKDANGVFGYIGTASTTAYNDIGYTPDLSITPPIPRILFTALDAYPGTSAYFQQRHIFARTNSDQEKLWASRTGSFKNFTISSPVQDDDAITFRIPGNQVNEIRWLIEIRELIILTSGGEWTLDSDNVLTPTSPKPERQGYNGAADIRPCIIGNTLVYVQARGGIVRDLKFDITADGYQGRDLTIFSCHLFEGYTLQRMDYAQIPNSIIWLIRSDGKLIGLTYMREQEVWGWHVHETDGYYEDICCVPEGDEDALYVIVRRTINGSTKRYVERFASRRVTDVRIDALFLDSFLSYDGRNIGAATMELTTISGWYVTEEVAIISTPGTFVVGDVGNAIVFFDDDGNEALRVNIVTYVSANEVHGNASVTVPVAYQAVPRTQWARAVDRVAGLDHLEGKTVHILADGQVITDATVTGGVIDLAACFWIMHIGLGYISDFETLDMDIAGANIRDNKKKISSVSLLVKETRGGFIGPDTDNLDELKTDVPVDYEDLPPLTTGLVDVSIANTWEQTGRFVVRQTDPLPMTILAAIPHGDIGG